MEDILFSIGIPAFKSQYLQTCIESVLRQTYSNFELIIINDCSPFPVDVVVEAFKDERISYFSNESNTGAEHVVDNWNKCLQKASGEFFLLLGDDDALEPEFLAEFYRLVSLYPDLDIFHCRSLIIDGENAIRSVTPSRPEYESVYSNIWHRMNGLRIQFISDFIYRRSVLQERGGFYKLPLAWASDDISAFLAMGGKGIAHTEKPVFRYRNNSLTITKTGNRRLKLEAILLEENWYENFLKQVPEVLLDKVFYAEINKGYQYYCRKKRIREVSASFSENGLGKLFYWLKSRREIKLRYPEIFYAMLDAFLNKLKKNN